LFVFVSHFDPYFFLVFFVFLSVFIIFTAVNDRISELKRLRAQQKVGNLADQLALRLTYNKIVDEMHKSGISDAETASKSLANTCAVARLRARDFMNYVQENQINLRECFQEFDKNNIGSIKVSDFTLIVQSFHLGWTDEDYMSLTMMFGSESHGRVSLAKIMGYGKTYFDRW